LRAAIRSEISRASTHGAVLALRNAWQQKVRHIDIHYTGGVVKARVENPVPE
jgi:hypothetical protein